jgi:hypothetical protein
MRFSEAFWMSHTSPAMKLALGGVGTSVVAKAALGGVGTSGLAKRASWIWPSVRVTPLVNTPLIVPSELILKLERVPDHEPS